MSSINVVVVSGNLTRDPELRHTPSGVAVATLRLAVNGREKIDGEWADRPSYFDVIVWAGQAETCAEYLSKGSGVVVSGRLRSREWEASDGSKRQTVEIQSDNVRFMGGRTGRGDQQSTGDFVPPADVPDNDIPF